MLRLAPHLKHHFLLCLYTFAFAPRVISIPANKSIAHISYDEAKKYINFEMRIFEHRLKGSSVGGLKGPRFDIELLRTGLKYFNVPRICYLSLFGSLTNSSLTSNLTCNLATCNIISKEFQMHFLL